MAENDVIKERSEVLFVYETTDCNPNGDPLDENKPRTDPVTRVATVTDVRIKRWIRDYWLQRLKKPIWVMEERKEDATLCEAFERARKKMEEANLKLTDIQKKREKLKEFKDFVLKSWIDIRVFGCVMPTAGKKEEEKSPTIALTGPVQIAGFNRSLHKVLPQFIQGTAAFAGKEGSYQRSFREDHILPYACIAVYGIVNEVAAKDTKMTERDRELFIEGLWLGCKDLITRSKVGHQPLLLLHIVYKDGCSIGNLAGREKISLKTEIEETAIRSTQDFTLDVSGLFKALAGHKDKIESVQIKHEPRLRLNVENLKESLEGLELKVEPLSLECPSKREQDNESS
jgi:CRISPR-associated protein Csh2